MSVESLMVHEVTLLSQSGETQSSSGEVTVTYSSAATTMYLEPTRGGAAGGSWGAGREEDADRNTPIGDWLGIGRADIDWDSTQRITYNEHTFDVIAPPRYMPNPRLGTISHVELSLQEVDTIESVDAIATPDVVGGEGGI
jgi:hypothetical protein